MNGHEDCAIFPELDADINHFNELYPSLNVDDQCQYYDDSKVKSIEIGKEAFSLFSFNCRSLLAHQGEISACLDDFAFNFDISLTESWLQDGNKKLADMNRYVSFHSLRSDKGGGGISVYVRDIDHATVIEGTCISTDYIECLGLKLETEYKIVYVLAFYRPPNANVDLFIEKFAELLLLVDSCANSELYVCGDFNIDLLELDNSASVQHYMSTCNSLSLLNVITKPTRVTDDTATLLDHIWVTDPTKTIAGVIVNDISDHFPTFIVSLDLFKNRQNDGNGVVKYRVVNNVTITNMIEYMTAFDLNDIAENNNCDVALSRLNAVIQEAFDTCCPIRCKTVSSKSRLKPWINYAILGNIRKRRAYYTLYRQQKIPKSFYIQFRNFVTLQIRNAKQNYYKQKFQECRKNTK